MLPRGEVGGWSGVEGGGIIPCRSGSCFGTAVLRDESNTLHKQCASGARPGLSVHDFRRTTSGVRLPAYGFRCTASGARLPASFQRLPAHGFRLPLHGSRRTASGAWISASHARLPAHAGSGTGRPLMIRAHSFLCVTVSFILPARKDG